MEHSAVQRGSSSDISFSPDRKFILVDNGAAILRINGSIVSDFRADYASITADLQTIVASGSLPTAPAPEMSPFGIRLENNSSVTSPTTLAASSLPPVTRSWPVSTTTRTCRPRELMNPATQRFNYSHVTAPCSKNFPASTATRLRRQNRAARNRR